MSGLFQRSVLKLGSGDDYALAVTLPISWVRFYGVRAGDKLVMITNGDIVIRPPTERPALAQEKAEGT